MLGSSFALYKMDKNGYFKAHRAKSIGTAAFMWVSGVLLAGLYQVNKINGLQQKAFQDLDYIAEIFQNKYHSAIQSPDDANSETYINLINSEKKWIEKEKNFYLDIYTIRKNAFDQNILIVDSETDYDQNGRFDGDREQRTPIGEVYEKELLALEKVFSTHQAAFDDVIYTDKWGTFVSGFYPIFDKKGQLDAVVGVDFDANKLIWEAAFENLISSLLIISFYLTWMSYLYNQYSSILFYKSLEESLRKNEESLKFQKQFVATVSHELRTPLNGMTGALNLIEFEKLNPNELENMRIIRQCTNVLTDIVGDVLDLSKIESGQLSLEKKETNVVETVTNIRILFAKQMIQKGLKFDIEIDDQLNEYVFLTDELRLRQVLINFISNAYKFTVFGQIKLSAKLLSIGENKSILQFKVSDTGVGFNLEQEKRLFKAFSQADASITRKFGGTGLGLVICKNLIEMMGGELYFHSKPNYGSTFIFTIQSGFKNQIKKSPLLVDQKIEKTNFYDLKVLVADDVMVNQVVLSKTLNKLGYKVELAANGIEVLERHETIGFDLIFMDCQMPLMDGFKATKEIREIEQKRNLNPVFIVAVTGNSTAEDQKNCFDVGMNHFLAKPFRPEDIEKVIQLAFVNKQQNENKVKAA